MGKGFFLQYSPWLKVFTKESKDRLKALFGDQEINFNFIDKDINEDL